MYVMGNVLMIKIYQLFIVVFLCVGYVDAQEQRADNKPPDNPFIEPNEIESVSRIIDTDKSPNDQKVKDRIESILDASSKYESLGVRVDDGIVFLEGVAKDLIYIEWAADIAKNVDGSVAVINNIDTAPVDYFTIQPIKNELLKVWFKGLEILPMVVFGLVTLFVFFSMSRPISSWLMKPISYVSDSQLIQAVLRRVISIFIMLIGFYFFLRIAGLTQFAIAIISGTGMLGLILGFAFRDIAENFISSLLISVQRPFQIGDVIEVSSHKGVVRKVTARGTTLIDFDGNYIQIPNSIIYKNVIQNFSANPKVRGQFVVGIGYDASIQNAQELALNLMLEHKAVLNDPEPQVLVDQLGSSTVNLKLYFWIDSETYAVNKVASLLMRQVMRAFENSGISMPDDAREVIFPNGVPVMINNEKNSNQVNDDHKGDKHNRFIKEKYVSSIGAEISSVGYTHLDRDLHHDDKEATDDLGTDMHDIRKQADATRDPEEGDNII